MFKYKAMSDGTLSNPYRHVKAGDIVTSEIPLKASWLAAPNTPDAPELPITPYTLKAGSQVEKILVPPVASNEGYDNNTTKIIERENREDGVVNEKIATGDGEQGTGNTDVL